MGGAPPARWRLGQLVCRCVSKAQPDRRCQGAEPHWTVGKIICLRFQRALRLARRVLAVAVAVAVALGAAEWRALSGRPDSCIHVHDTT